MKTKTFDYADGKYRMTAAQASHWQDLIRVLDAMPLHLKPSDQARRTGSPIFDPIGTNQYLTRKLLDQGWQGNWVLPADYAYLGLAVDFFRDGILLEAQFSNYPFLLNNVLRAELLFRSKTAVATGPVETLWIITKAGVLPASNSTLYFEQADSQITALVRHEIIKVPTRLIGLDILPDLSRATWSTYKASRYSRIPVVRREVPCKVLPARAPGKRCRIEIPPT